MAVKTKIPLEKIMALKKRLHNLPPKDTGKTREEAMEILAPVFQSALSKGYSLKELRGMTTEEGVTLALSGLAEKKAGERKMLIQENGENIDLPASVNREQTAGEQKISARKIAAEAMKTTAQAEEKSTHAIIVKPDTPDEEL
jgi:hypothetical protein